MPPPGRGADWPADEDPEGQRQPAAGARTGRSSSMNEAASGASAGPPQAGPHPLGGSAGVSDGRGAGMTAAVTGGSAGIGKAICEDLLARGYEVISLARRPADID